MLLVGFGKMMKKKLLIKDRDLVHHYCLNHRLELAYKRAMKKHIAFPTIDKRLYDISFIQFQITIMFHSIIHSLISESFSHK